MQNTDPQAVVQARAAWEIAVRLLMNTGMADSTARRVFGRILSKHHLHASKMLTAVRAAEDSGTPDIVAYLQGAARGVAERAQDPALKASWC